jgi:hypothetical protein
MTHFLIPLRLALSILLLVAFQSHVLADTNIGSLSGAPAPLIDFSGAIEMPTSFELSETVDACAVHVGNSDCDATEPVNLAAAGSGDDTSGPLFLLSVLALPQPSDVELFIASPADSSAPPRQPNSLWLLVAVSAAIALIGASGALRFRRTSASRA